MKILVLFDGAGLARLGLEQAGHECLGVEIDKWRHYLGKFVGSGNVVLGDAITFDVSGFDAIWASPPCQEISRARTQGDAAASYSTNYLDWCLQLESPTLWVENVLASDWRKNSWGKRYNANQFLQEPIQNRARLIGGRYKMPFTYRGFNLWLPGVCPTITATEYKGYPKDQRRAARFYKRRLTVEECAYHQGFTIPEEWYQVPGGFSKAHWYSKIYEVIGNGVPVYMAKAFGLAYSGE